MLVCFLSQNLVCLSLLVIPHRKEGNSDSVIGPAKKLKFDLFSAFLIIFVFFISVIVLATATFTKVVHFIVLFFLQTRRKSKSCFLEGNKKTFQVLLFCCLFCCNAANCFWQGFLTWGSGIPPTVPIPLSAVRCSGCTELAAWEGRPYTHP